MSCFDVKILDPNIHTIEIESCIGDKPSSIEIITFDNTNILEVTHCVALLPSELNDLVTVKDILAGSGIAVVKNSGIYTVSLSDPNISATGIYDLLETVQDIIGKSGLIAGNYININYDDNTGSTTISATGLQPSGNYSLIGHTHVSNDIIDFNSSVSGLLPVKNISGGSGIGVSSSSGSFIISVTGTFGLTGEEVDDRISQLIVPGNYIHINYDDLLNHLTISVTGLQPSGNYSVVGHTHTSSDITDFNSAVSGLVPIQNIIGNSGIKITSISGTTKLVSTNFIAGNGIALSYNNDDSLTISTITNNGLISVSNNTTTTFIIPNGYTIGSLSIYQNGVKLLNGIDYTATDGTNIVLTHPATSGSYIEYISPIIINNTNNNNNIYDTNIYSLGTLSGSVPINYGTDRMIQTFTMDSNPITLTRGTGWPTTNISRDVMLQITCINTASITWNIVGSNWYNPPTSTLPSGEYMILLRAMGTGVIQGHYIGNKNYDVL